MNTVISIVLLLMMAGCATYADLGNGRVARTLTTEERSMFGTNAGFMQLQNCLRVQAPSTIANPTYQDCTPMSAWVPISSQGVGGQVVGGALTGLGFGLGSAFAPSGGASAVQSQAMQSIVTVPGKGGH